MKQQILKISKVMHIVNLGVLSSCVLALFLLIPLENAEARDFNYTGGEEARIYVTPGEPTQVSFPGKIKGGFMASEDISIKRQDNFVVVFAQQGLSPDGDVLIIHLEDSRAYSLRVIPSGFSDHQRDSMVKIIDTREPEFEEESVETKIRETKGPYPSPSVVPGLMRELILISEFSRKKGIPGYRRSNIYSGETVLNDGTVSAVVDEIF